MDVHAHVLLVDECPKDPSPSMIRSAKGRRNLFNILAVGAGLLLSNFLTAVSNSAKGVSVHDASKLTSFLSS